MTDSLFYRSVAQLGRALRSGRRGRRFESCHSDLKSLDFTGFERLRDYLEIGNFFIPAKQRAKCTCGHVHLATAARVKNPAACCGVFDWLFIDVLDMF